MNRPPSSPLATPRRRAGVLALSCGAFLASLFNVLPRSGDADVIRLRTGAAIKGDPLQQQSDEKHLVIEDFVTGAVRRLQWEVVDPADRNRLFDEFGWSSNTVRVVPGHRVRQRLADGTIEDVLGLVKESGPGGTLIVVNGKEIRIPAAQVDEIIEEEMDPRDIWTAGQLYERARAELAAEGVDLGSLGSREHFRLAETAAWAGALEPAREHYAAAAADEGYLQAPIARQRLGELEALLRDRASINELMDIRTSLSFRAFGRARARLATFETSNPDVSDAVKRRFQDVKRMFDESRTKWLRDTVRTSFTPELKDAIRLKLREKDLEFGDVTAWMRNELPEGAFEAVRKKCLKQDPDVTIEDVRQAWTDRRKLNYWSASFGSGTFIQFKPVVTAPKNQPRGNQGRGNQSGAGPQVRIEIPKPPTRDSWWAKAEKGDLADFILAKFAMESGLFEVNENHVRTACLTCTGEGLIRKTNTNGTPLAYLCPRCGGARFDVRIKFR